MNRSGNTGFNGLVFFGNRGDGLFLLEQDSPERCGRSKRKSRSGVLVWGWAGLSPGSNCAGEI